MCKGSRALAATVMLLTAACGGGGGGGSSSDATGQSSPPPSQPSLTPFSPPAPSTTPRPDVAFVDVTVLSMTSPDASLENHTVLVRDGRIEAVGPVDQIAVPDGVVAIDGAGRFLMPGLADMHVHTNNANDLFLYLANGITTVRMMWGTDVSLERRAEIDTEAILAPRYFTAGRGMDGRPPFWPETVVVETEAQARQAVAAQHADGVDFIKVYNRLNRVAYDAIIEEASRLGIPVIGHVPAAVDVNHALAVAHVCTEHMIGYARLVMQNGSNSWGGVIDDQRLGDAVAQIRDSGTWTSPTLTVLTRTRNDVPRVTGSPGWRYISPDLREWLSGPQTQPGFSTSATADANRKRVVRALYDGGAPLLLGTDTGVQYVLPGYSLHEELANWVVAGLTPAQVLFVATASAAEFLGLAQVTGKVVEGVEADLLLLSADPRVSVANVQQRVGVMLRGRWYSEEQLQDWLEDIAASYGR